MNVAELIDRPGGCRLSEGLHATRTGIRLDDRMVEVIAAWFQIDTGEAFDLCYQWVGKDGATYISNLWPWSDAAKRLRYREGQPWCRVRSKLDIAIECLPGSPHERLGTMPHRKEKALDCFIAILCDDVLAFRVLYWCITELGGKNES